MTNYHPSVTHLLQYFEYLQQSEIAVAFHRLAHKVAEQSPDDPETTVCLRKLLEAKDAAVRAMLGAKP